MLVFHLSPESSLVDSQVFVHLLDSEQYILCNKELETFGLNQMLLPPSKLAFKCQHYTKETTNSLYQEIIFDHIEDALPVLSSRKGTLSY